jgi:ribonuclease HII
MNSEYIVAVDEVGVGSMAGPVVSCAVLQPPQADFKKNPLLAGVKDSKLLSPNKRDALASNLKKVGIIYSISYSFPKIIDKLNIRNASLTAMGRAVNNVIKKQSAENKKIIVLVDGPNELKNVSYPQKAIIKGDRFVFLISCASILAKVYRDKMMIKYAKKYPGYGFDEHKGYGTNKHKVQLVRLGPTQIHRKSFSFGKI